MCDCEFMMGSGQEVCFYDIAVVWPGENGTRDKQAVCTMYAQHNTLTTCCKRPAYKLKIEKGMLMRTMVVKMPK